MKITKLGHCCLLIEIRGTRFLTDPGSYTTSQNTAVDYALEIKPRVAFPVHDGNLVRQNGITVRLPNIELPKVGIRFIALELGSETEL